MLEALDDLRRHPTRAWVLLLCVVIAVVHQATKWDWFIDDAAICFAFARNIAMGEGVVPWPGAERIEAISDPLWVALLAVFYGIGLDGFEIAKPLGMLFAVPTLFVTWRLARHAMPEHHGPGALLAPLLLAISAQFAIWSASGLENALFCFLLATAMWRTLEETRHGGFPWSSFWYLLLAWTRPEGVLYAAVGGFWFLVGSLETARGLRRVGTWLLVFWVPSLLLEAARYAYFAWPVPNTYWAKIDNRGVAPLLWWARGWVQLREWAGRLWHGYYVPIYVVALTGIPAVGADRRWLRLGLGLGITGLVAAFVMWPGASEGVLRARIVVLTTVGLLLPFLAVGVPGGRARLLLGTTFVLGLGWSILADGDWMGAYRWMSLVSVPAAVLLATGIVAVADALDARIREAGDGPDWRWGPAGWVAASFLGGLLLSPNASQLRDHTFWNINETTQAIKTRVDHTRSVVRRTFYEERVVNLEVDQGAHLWWAPDYTEVDMAMLVDIPMGRHWYHQHAFIEEWVFEENPPTFAHVGGWWAQHSGFLRYPGWWDDYFHIPPHEDPRFDVPFVGVYARRDMVMMRADEAPPGPSVPVEGGIWLEGLTVPAPAVEGRDLYLEAPISLDAPRGEAGEVQMVVIVFDDAGEERHRARLRIGYDLLPQAWFRPREVFRGQHAVRLPEDLPPGTYHLRLAFYDAYANPLAARGAPEDLEFRGVVRVLSDAAMQREVQERRSRIASLAEEGRCAQAEQAWILLKRHLPRAWRWHGDLRELVGPELATCWAEAAPEDPSETVDRLARAHFWDHHSDALREVGRPLADRWMAEGREALAAEDWERAYRRFADVLRFEPWRAWARRWAEEARDHRLGLHDDVRIGIGGADNWLHARGE